VRGISIRKTDLGFNVMRLHYTADPDKDPRTPEGKHWLEETQRGISAARFRKEYEIDYTALGGQLVFPGFDESVHMVPLAKQSKLDPAYFTVWMACDPHPRAAHAFLWLAVNADGEKAVVWSWWPQERHAEQTMVTKDYAADIRGKIYDVFPELKPRRMLMDVAGRSFNADEEKSYFDKYRECGLNFQPAKKNRDLVGYDLINDALTPREYVVGNEKQFRPQLTIWDRCGDNHKLVSQLKGLRFREWKGNVSDKDPPEEPQQKERHLVDCLSYILLDNPRFIPIRKNRSTFEVINEGTGW